MGITGSRKDEAIDYLRDQQQREKAKQLLKEGIIKMDTRQCEQVKQVYLLEEVMRTHKLAMAMKARIWDIFIKEKQGEITKDEAPPPNPIDHAISISQSTQHALKGCLELLELEIISKLVGK